MRTYQVLLLLSGLSLAACGDPAGLTIERPGGSTGTPTTGTPSSSIGARITTTTTGLDIDLEDYQLTVDGGHQEAIPPYGTTFIQLDTGSRTLSLTGVNPNCALAGPVSRKVTVVAAHVVPIEFVVQCTATRPQPPPRSGILAFENRGDIYVADMDGSHLGRLTSDNHPDAYPYTNAHPYSREAAWSPDGGRIAYSKVDSLGGAAVYVIGADGTNPRRLSPEGAYDATPSWSPDGRQIVVENRADNTSGGQVLVMNADGTDRVQLTSNRQPTFSPAWSPDGHRIAFVTYGDSAGEAHIYVMDADGTNRVRLTNDDASEGDPEWSPDGSRIVFSRSRELVVVNADGTNPSQLTTANADGSYARSYAPAWSPDGRMIAFTRNTNCREDSYGDEICDVGTWVLGIPGGEMQKLPLQGSGPSWRP